MPKNVKLNLKEMYGIVRIKDQSTIMAHVIGMTSLVQEFIKIEDFDKLLKLDLDMNQKITLVKNEGLEFAKAEVSKNTYENEAKKNEEMLEIANKKINEMAMEQIMPIDKEISDLLSMGTEFDINMPEVAKKAINSILEDETKDIKDMNIPPVYVDSLASLYTKLMND